MFMKEKCFPCSPINIGFYLSPIIYVQADQSLTTGHKMESQAIAASQDIVSEITPTKEFVEPAPKKRKSSKLEDRLSNILSCNVCFDLPPSACYQCCRGHLMCVACYNHLLADGKLKDEQTTCPSCRVDIGDGSCTRNLAAEKAISELPVDCQYCSTSYARHMITSHQKSECLERLVCCRFSPLGCVWSGPHHESQRHESNCNQPNITGEDILDILDSAKREFQKELSTYRHIVSLLSYDQLTYHDLQLRPYRTNDFVTRLYYESNRFHALCHTWVVKAYIDNVEKNPSNPTAISDRKLNYQLILKSKIHDEMEVYSVMLRAPYEEAQVSPEPVHHRFTKNETESELRPITVSDANMLIGSRLINIRLFLFHHKQ